MADVFISYASEDRDRAGSLARALESNGWSVWWDRKIVAGETFDQVIERELDRAGCTVVLWSAHSIDSEWVKNEAAAAAERGMLVPARIEDVKLPLEFRRKQTADLTGWAGEETHSGFEALGTGVAAVLDREPTVRTGRSRSPTGGGNKLDWRRAAAIIGALLIILAATTLWLSRNGPEPPSVAHDADTKPANVTVEGDGIAAGRDVNVDGPVRFGD